MRNKYLKNLNRIEFVVTTACTGKCKHCSQGEHKSNEIIDKISAVNALKKTAETYNITSVMTFGGEPLLCCETVCEIHKTAKELNIPKRQLITNGFFSKDLYEINYVAQKLTESGVNEILLSVDAFHQETIPLEYVKAFAKAIDFSKSKLQVHPAWLVSSDDNNPYNNKTKELLNEFNLMGIETSAGNVVFPMGNAVKYLGDYLNLLPENENPYWENPSDIHAICISANGDVLGSNIHKKDMSEILSDYQI